MWFPLAQGSGFHAEVVGLCLAADFVPNVVQEIAPMDPVVGLVGGQQAFPSSLPLCAR